MNIGCTKEIKNNEFRVGLTPENVKEYVNHGHSVFVENDAGVGAGFFNEEYLEAGATILNSPQEIFKKCEMIIKVKELEESEYKYLKDGQILFTYLHLASNPKFTEVLKNKNIIAIGYETILDNGILPCLIPMSKIAGKLSIYEGIKFLQKTYGGSGVLVGNCNGKSNGEVLVLGAGTVGCSAIETAVAVGAKVTVIDSNTEKLKKIEKLYSNNVTTFVSNNENIEKALKKADIVVGSVLIPGGTTPKLVRKEHLISMKKGSVIVDVAIDQGGCFETSHVTTHEKPTFIVNGIVHYCVGNMPGSVPHTATIALTDSTIKYGLMIADGYLDNKDDKDLENIGVNIYKGRIINKKIL